MNLKIKVNLPEKVGRGYKSFWNYKGRYRVVKGGRGSKKSTTATQWFIYNMMKYPLANTLVVRRVFNTHKDSTWTQLKWATYNLNVSHLWYFSKSPLEATYIPTGQKILFRGLDDPMGITSITVEKGFLCWVWFEEAFQIMDEDSFNKVDMSVRGELPEGYFKQLTLTFNPWSEKHWMKKRFFDEQDLNVLAMTTDYKCNEFLGLDDINLFEEMKIKYPRRYNIEGIGNWGIAEGLIYENFTEEPFSVQEIIKNRPDIKSLFGLDFGYTNDPSALFCGLIDQKENIIYVFDEFYKTGLTNKMIFDEIEKKGYTKEKIIADSAEPKSIQELRGYGLRHVTGARKGKDSINNGIQFIQNFKLVIHPRCVNFSSEVNNYAWGTDKFGNSLNRPIDDFNHLMDAMRYACERYSSRSVYSFD